jgi:uncharacterized protein
MKVDISLVAQLTERCNLNCAYCYLKEKKPRDMSPETAENIVRSFLSYNDKYGHFTWVGGEPLLMGDGFLAELIKYGERHNQKGLDVSHSLQTNALLLSPERRNYLKGIGFKVGASYDGCADLQETLRGAKTAARILDNIAAAGKSLGVIAVLTKKTIGREEEIFDNLRSLTTRARINLYTPSGEGLSKVDELLPGKEETLQSMIKFYELWKKDESGFILNPFTSMIRGFYTGWVKTCEYSAYSCYRLLGADPDGNIHLCSRSTHLPETKLGNINTDKLEDMIGSQRHQTILDRYLYLKEKDCSGCKWFSMCSGGCPVEAISYMGSPMNKTYYCEVKGGLFERMNGDLQDDRTKNRLARKIGISK